VSKTTGLLAGLMVLGAVSGASAQEGTVSKREFDALQAKVEQLTALLEAQQQKPQPPTMMAEKGQNVDEKIEAMAAGLPEGLEFGAVIEVEGGYTSRDSEDESDITLATVELSAGWQLDDWLRADLVFLYEEDDTDPMDVDQAIITLGNTDEFPLFLQVGKMYVPFGNLDSFFITDPVVVDLAEAQETAGLIGFEKGGFSASLSAFNGDVETSGENQIENLVAAASYGIDRENASLHFGVSWIRNIMDSDSLTEDVLEDVYGDDAESADDTGGFDAWATAAAGPATFIVEYVTALDEIDVDGENTGLEPESLNLELGVALSDRIEVAGRYEESNDVADWFAKSRYGVVGSYLLSETDLYSTSLSLEYMKEDFDLGEEDADIVTMQLALEF
jgi:hypothetical protein